MHNKLTMRRFGSFWLMGITVAVTLTACGSKTSGPDQTLVLPSSDWKITDHEPGDASFARWVVESNGTSIELFSISPTTASKDSITRLDNFRTYLLTAGQSVPVLSRYWSDGDVKYNRQYAPTELTDVEHGSVSILGETPMHAFTFIVTNPKMKKDELTDLAEKTAIAFVKANLK